MIYVCHVLQQNNKSTAIISAVRAHRQSLKTIFSSQSQTSKIKINFRFLLKINLAERERKREQMTKQCSRVRERWWGRNAFSLTGDLYFVGTREVEKETTICRSRENSNFRNNWHTFLYVLWDNSNTYTPAARPERRTHIVVVVLQQTTIDTTRLLYFGRFQTRMRALKPIFS